MTKEEIKERLRKTVPAQANYGIVNLRKALAKRAGWLGSTTYFYEDATYCFGSGRTLQEARADYRTKLKKKRNHGLNDRL